MKTLLITLLIPISLAGQSFKAGEISKWREQAKHVSITRDNWGVPHIYGKTDADCIFGFAYSQAEDNIEHLIDNYILSLGRGSELRGEKLFNDDYLAHAFQVAEKAEADYHASTPEMKKLYNAFAAGVNYYIAVKKPEIKLIDRVEPWYPLAMLLYKYYILEFVEDAGIDKRNLKIDTVKWTEKSTGSNQWAVNGSKCNDSKSLLFINPHVLFFGFGTFTEAHIVSEEGWNFSGVSRTGFLLPYMGHNEHLGWGFTDNYADKGDMYTEVFDKPDNELLYKHGAGYREAMAWQKTILIKSNNKTIRKKVTFKKTHHGPIISVFNGLPVAVKLARYDEVSRWYDQYYAMTKAKDFTSFRNALDLQAQPYMNTTYADDKGNIYYLYNSLIPKRDDSFDWRLPVDGSNPKTEWNGYHLIAELPQVLNPVDNFVQNCNSSPFLTTTRGNPAKENFPNYMADREADNARSKRSKEILSGIDHIDFLKWQTLVTDQKVWLADSIIKQINDEFALLEKQNQDSAALIRPLIEELTAWDKISSIQSVAMTLFDKTITHYFTTKKFTTALLKTKIELEKSWGSWKVPYGEVSRLQRVHWSMEEGFSDKKSSLPIAGGRSLYGTIFCFTSIPQLWTVPTQSENKRNYGIHGNSYVSAVEFGDKRVRAVSILPFGQSGDPKSKHYADQSGLYTKGLFKEAWFYQEDILRNALRTYHPGE